jgi:hypothetical protein
MNKIDTLEEQSIQGKVESVIDLGSIVQMLVVTDQGRLYPVSFDHRMFFNMWEDLGRVNLKGQRVVVHGEQFVDQRVEFPDLET